MEEAEDKLIKAGSRLQEFSVENTELIMALKLTKIKLEEMENKYKSVKVVLWVTSGKGEPDRTESKADESETEQPRRSDFERTGRKPSVN